MREAMFAIIKKDFRGITGNRRLFTTLMITPLIFNYGTAIYFPVYHSLCAG